MAAKNTQFICCIFSKHMSVKCTYVYDWVISLARNYRSVTKLLHKAWNKVHFMMRPPKTRLQTMFLWENDEHLHPSKTNQTALTQIAVNNYVLQKKIAMHCAVTWHIYCLQIYNGKHAEFS